MEAASVGLDASELDSALAALQRQGRSTRDVMRSVALLLVEEADENFETEGHGKWPGFSENTLRARGDTSSAKLLQDTGRLAASIIANFGPDFAEAFTNVDYAKYHVSDKEPRTKIPKRDFFDIDTLAVAEEAVDLLLKEVTK